MQIFHDARRYERKTRGTTASIHQWRGRRAVISRQDGVIGRAGLAVLHALLFDFLNFKNGRLDPCYASIAEKACVSVRTVHRALVKLKAARVLHWEMRCEPEHNEGGGYLLRQISNAYGVRPATQWPGYHKPADAPAPPGDTWGARPPAASPMELAAQEIRHGQHQAAQRHLESDPGDALAAAVAKLGRHRFSS